MRISRQTGSKRNKMALGLFPVHFKGVTTLHSQFAFEIYNWYNAQPIQKKKKQFTLPQPPSFLSPPSNSCLLTLHWRHVLEKGTVWLGLGIGSRLVLGRFRIWFDSTGLCHKYFCSIKCTNLMCCHGYMRIDDSTYLTRALSTLAGHSKQDL